MLDRERQTTQNGPVDAADAVDDLEVGDVERELCRDGAHRSYTSRIPSATRFTATTRLAIASAGKSVIHQYGSISVQYWLICAAQSGEGGGDAEPDERQRGDGEDRVAEPHRELDHDRRHHVREDLGEHDVGRALAPQARSLDVVELRLGEHGGAHRPRDDRA